MCRESKSLSWSRGWFAFACLWSSGISRLPLSCLLPTRTHTHTPSLKMAEKWKVLLDCETKILSKRKRKVWLNGCKSLGQTTGATLSIWSPLTFTQVDLNIQQPAPGTVCQQHTLLYQMLSIKPGTGLSPGVKRNKSTLRFYSLQNIKHISSLTVLPLQECKTCRGGVFGFWVLGFYCSMPQIKSIHGPLWNILNPWEMCST